MKYALIAAFALLAGPATAVGLPAPPTLYTCAGHALSRVAYATSAPCCVGKIRCPQFLATTTLMPRPHPDRT